MCGIAGIASRVPLAPGSGHVLRMMRDAMHHRGPDDAGEWHSEDGRVSLGHRRLAILDLSPKGHQPMSDVDRVCWVSFNGEIYNFRNLRKLLEDAGHKFVTQSDTEILLEGYKEWGINVLQKLEGMFAFALYDCRQRRLFLARDRAGEKPLYYRLSGGMLHFASELKGLMANPSLDRRIDGEALSDFLAFGYVAHDRCILSGVRKLPQGCVACFDVDSAAFKSWEYWTLPQWQGGNTASPEELELHLERLLESSVRNQLVADVPVGILLSGGIDSSLVVAMAARVSSNRVKTFTISFPGSGTYNESPFAKMVADHFGTDHVDLPAESASPGAILPLLARQYDEPFADSSMVPTFLVSKLIRQHATVALGGDGGDELFGGYLHYTWLESLERWRRLVPGTLRALAGSAAARLLPIGFRGRNYISGFAGDASRSISHFNLFFDAIGRRRFLALGAQGLLKGSPERFKQDTCGSETTALRKATRSDFRSYLVDDILVKVDRASMLSSLEVRAPWLDKRIIEFAFGEVPDRLRASKQDRKILPKRLAARLLPKKLDLARKQGFSIPFDQWFRADWGPFIREVLNSADPELWNRQAIADLVRGQESGRGNSQRIFAITMFELWRHEYKIGL